MSYTDVFGGGSINPSQRTYQLLTISADVELAWPIEQQVSGNDVVADIMDVDPQVAGLNVDFGDARQVSKGFTSLFNNIGAETVTIRDSAGGTIISLATGEAWFVYLTDNSTAAGTWRTFQLGASVASASAAALAGAGLKAISTTLNQTVPPTLQASTPFSLVNADRAELHVWTGGVGTANLPNAGTVGSDWFVMMRNGGSGDLTVTPPSGTVDGDSSMVLSPGESAILITDGSNYYTVGRGQQSTSIFDFIEIDVSGTGNFTLSGSQLNRVSYRFTGTLTGDRTIIVPNTVQQYWVDNQTTGAFSLYIKTSTQSAPGIEVLQNNRNILYCDGDDVVDAESGTVTLPLAIGQGGTGQITGPAALAALGGVPTSRTISAGGGMTGGGDLSANRTINVVGGAGIAVTADEVAADLLGFENLADPGADRVAFWDDSAGAMDWLVPGVTLVIGGNTLNVLAATLSVAGVVELATAGEVDAGLNGNVAVIPTSLAGSSNYSWDSGTFVPTFTGFSSDPASAIVRWYRFGQFVVAQLGFSVGTSDATTFTIGNVPAAIQPGREQGLFIGAAVDNTTDIDGATIRIQTGASWVVGAGHTNYGGGGWTASGSKGFGSSTQTIMYCLDFAP